MITSMVNADLEAKLPLSVVGAAGQQLQIDTVIDTGFNGFLTLPSAVIASLGLTWLGRELGVLADGSTGLFDVYRATVVWDGNLRVVDVEAGDADPLLGMAMLEGHELRMQVVDGGAVTVVALP
jgi:clan AA aspartic protease